MEGEEERRKSWRENSARQNESEERRTERKQRHNVTEQAAPLLATGPAITATNIIF